MVLLMKKTAFALKLMLVLCVSLVIVAQFVEVVMSQSTFNDEYDSKYYQSIPKPSVPEFTVEFIDSSYDVPMTYFINHYTGKTAVTQEGYHVENKTIQLTIKNQPQINSHGYYYNICVKEHLAENWEYLFPSMYSIRMLDSEYTIVNFSSSGGTFHGVWGSIFEAPSGGELDFQVQAFVGYMDYHTDGWTFETVESGWSDTQTLTLSESQATTPEPTSTPETTLISDPNFIIYVGIALLIMVGVGLGLLVYLIKRK